MDPKHRRVIKENRKYLIEHVSFDKVKPYLKEQKLFNKYMWEDLKSFSDVIDALPFRGPMAFQNMIHVLRQAKYDKEADVLETTSGELPDNLYYEMSSTPYLGYCLIINNFDFESSRRVEGPDDATFLTDRPGSEKDAESLSKFFESIDFEVTLELNLTAWEMEKCLKEFTEKDFRSVDSMVLIILSHGNQISNLDVVFGVDGMPYYTNDICNLFDNKIASLMHKPKVFFFVACRGDKPSYGVEYQPRIGRRESTDSSLPTITAMRTDMFLFHSTLPKEVSMRDHEEGTYFCQTFVPVLQKYHRTLDLNTIIDLVNKELQHKISEEYRCVQVVHSENFGGTKRIMLCRRN